MGAGGLGLISVGAIISCGCKHFPPLSFFIPAYVMGKAVCGAKREVEETVEFILHYWIEVLFGLIMAVLGWLVAQVKAKKKEYQMMNEAIVALLHDRLFIACQHYLAQGWCSVDDRENLECMYKPYSALGGNGTGEHLYHRVMELPLEKPPDNKHPPDKKE